jgi:CPA2 family monovalent cation:H+ antiporter-2
MPYLEVFLLLISTITAAVLILNKFKIEATLGYLVAGVILGPNGLSLITETQQIEFFGELGIILMLFNIGIELPLKRLRALRIFIFGIGGMQFLIVMPLIGFLMHYLFNMDFIRSAIIGAALALSSTALIIQLLSSKSELASRFGRITFCSLLFQDLAVVPMLIIMNMIDSDLSFIKMITGVSFNILAAAVILTIAGKFLLKPLFRVAAENKNYDIFLLITFCAITALSFVTFKAGLSLELGAFFAGLMLAESKYRHQIEGEIKPFRGILLGMFFVAVGMKLDINVLMSSTGMIVGMTLALMAIKILVCYFVCFLFRVNNSNSIRIAFILAGAGEFVFVLLSNSKLGVNSHIVDMIFCAVILSMILTPVLDIIGSYLFAFFLKATATVAKDAIATKKKKCAVIIGFDEVGQTIGKILNYHDVCYRVIDSKISKIDEWQDNGVQIIYVDTAKANVFANLPLENSLLFIVNIKNVRESIKIVSELKKQYPQIKIVVRCINEKHRTSLENYEIIIPDSESIISAMRLSANVLDICGVDYKDLSEVLSEVLEQNMDANVPTSENLSVNKTTNAVATPIVSETQL